MTKTKPRFVKILSSLDIIIYYCINYKGKRKDFLFYMLYYNNKIAFQKAVEKYICSML